MHAIFRLADHFKRPVSELNMTVREAYAWLAFLKLEPPGAPADARTKVLLESVAAVGANVMATITNMAGRSLPGKKMVEPADFMGKAKEKPQQTAAEQMAFMRSITTKVDKDGC